MMKARIIKVYGDVQGVNFRYFARQEAEKLGLFGWAQNDHDGNVSIFIQGDDEDCQNFIKWAQEGSPMARVENTEVKEIEIDDNLKGFGVK